MNIFSYKDTQIRCFYPQAKSKEQQDDSDHAVEERPDTISSRELFPTYPNNRWSGFGKAHTYAIKHLFSDVLDPRKVYERDTIPAYKL